MAMKRTLLFGLGGQGAVFALFLQRSSRTTLSTVARSNYEIVKNQGIRVEGERIKGGIVKFDEVFKALGTEESPASPPEDEDPFCYIVVCTKALSESKPSLVECLGPYVTPGKSTIVLIQNGVGIEDAIQERWPDNTVITVVSYVGGTLLSPGVVLHGFTTAINLGPFHVDGSKGCSDVERERIDTLTSMLNSGGCEARPIYDHIEMQAERWIKLAANTCWNGFTSLTDLDTLTYLDSSPFAEPLTRRLMGEIARVSRALGIEIDPSSPEALQFSSDSKDSKSTSPQSLARLDDRLIARYRRVPATTSMRMDLLHRRPMEVDAIFGVPLRHAKRLGIDTPVLETLWVTLSAVNARNAGLIKALI